MAVKRANRTSDSAPLLTTAEAESRELLCGLPGPGRWLILRYHPAALFSLKASSATSGVGRTLLVPTPYAVKMAFLDAALTSSLLAVAEADRFVRALARADVRVGVPGRAVVTHTIVKIRQEPKTRTEGIAYTPNVAYREFVFYAGELALAWDLLTVDRESLTLIRSTAPLVRYIGKRASFFQFLGLHRQPDLDEHFTSPVESMGLVSRPAHIAMLDDFGAEASFDALNSYSKTAIKREKHRKFVQTVVPLGRVNVGPGFTEFHSPVVARGESAELGAI